MWTCPVLDLGVGDGGGVGRDKKPLTKISNSERGGGINDLGAMAVTSVV